MRFGSPLDLWRRSKALSVLQTAYDMPLKFPLKPPEDTTLRLVTRTCFDCGGNEFDAAAAFMTLRIKSELEAELALGRRPGLLDARKEMGRLAVGISRTQTMMKHLDVHMSTLGEINSLRDKANEAERQRLQP